MIWHLLVAAFLVIGGSFGLIGSYGLLKLRHSMQRLHAPTKASTVGVGSVLLASAIYMTAIKGAPSWQEILVLILLFLTAPITALFLSKVLIHTMTDRSPLPPSGTASPWATLDTSPSAPEPRLPGQ